MRRFLILWFVLASSWLVVSLLIDKFAGAASALQMHSLVTMLIVTAVQSAMLQLRPRFFRSKPDESPDQHR